MSKRRKTLLWQIQKAGFSKSYLFGTMHVKDAIAYSYFKPVQPYIIETDIYAAEMDLDQASNEGQSHDVFLPNGQTLLDYISLKKFEKLRQIILKRFGLDLKNYLRFYPLLTTNLIAETLLSNDYHLALDYAMWQFAKESCKIMTGVESYQDQMHTLKKLSIQTQIKQLEEIGKNPSKVEKATSKMVECYFSMDIHKLYQFSKKGMGKMRKTLIYERNQFMSKRILSLMEEGSCFFAIGAGHLSGKSGLIRLLKMKEYELSPISLQKSSPDNPL
jgi:uncharacterized protein YbaP (TraB family)